MRPQHNDLTATGSSDLACRPEATRASLCQIMLLFVLMLTTGLRIGGVAKILWKNVAEIKNDKYIIKEVGKTREKGNMQSRQ